MIEKYIEEAWDLLKEYRQITPVFIMRKFQLSRKMATIVCQKIWLRQHLEARALAKDLEFEYWPAQLDKVRLKNLDKFKKKTCKADLH